jgi:hypothetical protein
MNNEINGCVHCFDAEAGAWLPILKKKTASTFDKAEATDEIAS